MNKRFSALTLLFIGILLTGAACTQKAAVNETTNGYGQPKANNNATVNGNVSIVNGATEDTTNTNSDSQNTNTATPNTNGGVKSNTNAAVNENVNTSDGMTNWTPLFGDQTKSAHFVSSTPVHTAVLAAAPNEVVLKFNFDLAANSRISVTATDPRSAIARGEAATVGTVLFDSDKLTMRQKIQPNATSEKLYAVNYTACWPDGSCHDGRFDFAVDPN
ncbi:MAG: copper resistance protein CopC [Candidatus Kerfeldbacteria bacterium]|nr:copper resistance protein CopC [Candidatus Kerfeldbacteria bacterium]